MKILILAGNDVSNKNWSLDLRKCLRVTDEVHILQYRHWLQSNAKIDIKAEVNRLAKLNKSWKDGCVVIAKSAGILVTLEAISNNVINPSRCIFIGLPLVFAQEFNFSQVFKNYTTPSLFIQNEHDPEASAISVKRFIESHQLKTDQIDISVLPASSHDYLDFPQMKTIFHNYIYQK